MSTFSFTVPTAPSTAKAKAITRRELLYGKDISYNVREVLSPNMEVTPSGDWATVAGRECLRQSLIRRLITEPGEWTTNPTYGVGALGFVKARDSAGNRDELERRIRSQFAIDQRVKTVDSVQFIRGENSIKVVVRVTPVAELDSSASLTISHEVS
jgi:hypothetical protein